MAHHDASPLASTRHLVRAKINGATDQSEFREVLLTLMALPGRILEPGGAPKFGSFVLDTCSAMDGRVEVALSAAAAVEFAIVATDVIDDIVDHEWVGRGVAGPQALSATLALNWLAQSCLRDLYNQSSVGRAARTAEILERGILAACTGEDLDLRLESCSEVSEDEALEMTQRKSGSLVAMALQVGAALATDDERILDLAGDLGMHIGTVSQLLNDIVGISTIEKERGSDLIRRKKTLPIAYALRCAREENFCQILKWYLDEPQLLVGEQEIADAIAAVGAPHFAWAVAKHQRELALRTLRQLVAATNRPQVAGLRKFIPAVRLQTRHAAKARPS